MIVACTEVVVSAHVQNVISPTYLPAGYQAGGLHKYVYWANWNENVYLPWALWQLSAKWEAGSSLPNANWVQNSLMYLQILMNYSSKVKLLYSPIKCSIILCQHDDLLKTL